MRNVAVIDIGKTNVKLVLIDRDSGSEVETFSQPNAVLPGPLYPQHDVKGIWAFILDGLKRFSARHQVDGISITTHGATAAIMRDGKLALPVLDYEFDGPEETRADYDAARPDFSETLSPRLPIGLNLGAQIFWQARAHKDAFAAADMILMYPQYWAYRLTGIAASEVTSLGCHTDLWNVRDGKLSSLVDGQSWAHLFPPTLPAMHVIGPITREIAEQTGLDPATPVTCGIHDSNASLLPWLFTSTERINVISSGTWTIVMSVGGDIAALDETRDCLAYVDAFGRAVPAARFMGGREFSELTAGLEGTPTHDDVATVIDKNAMVLPGFVPGVGPFPNSKGHWTFTPEDLSDRERIAAASLYMALLAHTCLRLASLGEMIVVEGPLARNAIFCSALAALAGLPVHVSADATGTSLGAALLFEKEDTVKKLDEPVTPMTIEGFHEYAAAWARAAGEA